MTRQRWRCECAYDGGDFAGWQSQPGGTAIQDVIEDCLTKILEEPIRIQGSGRTDAGVHARAQVFHFDGEWRHSSEKLLAAFRFRLPETIQIKSARPTAADFHARFDAKGKRYDYHVHLGDADPFTRPYCWINYKPLDLGAMRAAAEVLRGRHDFRALTALNGGERENTVRDLRRLEVRRRGRAVQITAEADGFLYKMARSAVGLLVAVGEGKLTVGDVRRILESTVRIPAVLTAPAHGLFLTKVYY